MPQAFTRGADAFACLREFDRAPDDDTFEQSYNRYLSRTHADWLQLLSFALLARDKIVSLILLTPFHVDVLLSLLALGIAPFATILGLWRSRDDFLVILRGRSSWTVALLSGLAFGALGFACIELTIFALATLIGPSVKTALLPAGSRLDLILSVVVIAPIVEEFIFQVALQTRLMRFGTIVSIVVTTIAFTALHLDNLGRIPTTNDLLSHCMLFPGLLMFAILRRWNGSLVALIVAHALSNWLAIECVDLHVTMVR